MSELVDFVEAPGRFMEPTEGVLVVKTPRFAVVAGADGVWGSIQGVRLREGEAPHAVAEVRALLGSGGVRVVSWWLSELSTPEAVEKELLDAGLQVVADDYLLDGLLATGPPPSGPPDVEARLATSAEEWVAIRELQEGIFDNPPERRPTREQLLAEFRKSRAVLFGAWFDGELVGAAGATPSSRGLLLWGGSVHAAARGRGCYRALVRALGRGSSARHTGAHRRRERQVESGAPQARLREGARAPSARGRTLGGVKEICPRCSAEMEWRHGTFQCPKCRLKIGCCEGETGDCRDPG